MTSAMVLLSIVQVAVLGAAPEIPGYEGETRKVLEASMKQYQALKTYQDGVTLKFDQEMAADSPGTPPESPKERISFTFTAPNKFALKTKPFSIYSDGKSLWEYAEPIGQYSEKKLPEPIVLDEMELSRITVFEIFMDPAARILLDPTRSIPEIFDEYTKYTGTQAEKRGDREGHLVSGERRLGPQSPRTAPFHIWINDKTGMIEEIVYDYTKMIQEDPHAVDRTGRRLKFAKYHVVYAFENIKLNEEIPSERFVIKPDPKAEKMDELDFSSPEERLQKRLVGGPAPEIKGTTLAGKKISLADFKDKVVLLDFWATWCGPCVQSMPTIQAIWEKYEKSGVVVIGINRDNPDNVQLVEKFLADRKFTYRQIPDETDSFAQAYRLGGIPCFVLIDKKGIVQKIQSGFGPNQGAELSRDIEKLLKGETLIKRKASKTEK